MVYLWASNVWYSITIYHIHKLVLPDCNCHLLITVVFHPCLHHWFLQSFFTINIVIYFNFISIPLTVMMFWRWFFNHLFLKLVHILLPEYLVLLASAVQPNLTLVLGVWFLACLWLGWSFEMRFFLACCCYPAICNGLPSALAALRVQPVGD